MTDGFGLFGDLGLEMRVSPPEDLHAKQVREAWNLWVEATDRPEAPRPNPRFDKAYRTALRNKFAHSRLLRAVRGAAYLEPHRRDPLDLGRVVNALRYPNVEAAALSLLDSGTAEVYPWNWEEVNRKSSLDDVREACGGDGETLWSRHDQEHAGIIIQVLTRNELLTAAEKVKTFLGEPIIWPSDLTKHRSVWMSEGRVQAKAVKGRDTYDAGAREAENLDDVDLSVDPAAQSMLLRGAPSHLVSAYHHDAPDGYWSEVDDLLEGDQEGEMTVADIFLELQSKYRWHPNQRSKPEW